MGLRLEPSDEYMHELGPEPNFNESMYFNVYDPAQKVGGWFRLGNRANEGTAEMTVCLYLPDGRVGFMFKRPDIADNDAFDAGGIRFDVVTPFEELDGRLHGQGRRCSTTRCRWPTRSRRSPRTRTPSARCTSRTPARRPCSAASRTRRTRSPGEEFAKGHYEQLVEATGSIRVGDEEWAIDGFGLRDHSWGPRYWQAPWYYRWLTANFGPDFGFMVSRIARRDGEGTRGGFVWDGREAPPLRRLRDRHGAGRARTRYHESITATLRSEDQEWRMTGKVLNLIPLRNRRLDPDGNMLVTRISEGMTEWTLDDGRIGYGLSEYLDQIIDGRPVGVAE